MSEELKDSASRVPALEKALDILELLAKERSGLLQKDVAARVGRSVSEVFRVLGVLEARGYIVREPSSGHYTLSLRLFELAHLHPPERRLIEVSLPIMERLANETRCSCHLVTRDRGQLIVVAQAQPDNLLMGWSVKVGAVFPMSARYASARTIAAFHSAHRQAELLASMSSEEMSDRELNERIANIVANGIEVSESYVAPGVIDVSCPILNHAGESVAALTMSCITGLLGKKHIEHIEQSIAPMVRSASRSISNAIGGLLAGD